MVMMVNNEIYYLHKDAIKSDNPYSIPKKI